MPYALMLLCSCALMPCALAPRATIHDSRSTSHNPRIQHRGSIIHHRANSVFRISHFPHSNLFRLSQNVVGREISIFEFRISPWVCLLPTVFCPLLSFPSTRVMGHEPRATHPPFAFYLFTFAFSPLSSVLCLPETKPFPCAI